MNRTINVLRMQFVNRQTYIWVPLLVLVGAWALTLIVFALIPYDGVKAGGGSQAPLWYFLVVGVQSLTMTFPFSQAMSVTRKSFYLGTLAAAAVTSLLLAAVFAIGGLIEQATNGYGMNGYFFYLDWIWERGWWAAAIVYFVIAMLFFITGFWSATIYKRWGTLWLTVALTGVGVLLVGAIWLIGRLDVWDGVIRWFGEQGALGLSLWGVLLGAVLATLSYLTLRRATP